MDEFGFLGIPRRGGKPRTNGLTMVRDAGLGLTHVREALATYGEYMDYAKIRQFLLWFTPSEDVRERIRTYNDAGLITIPGGTVYEAAHLRNEVPRTLETLRELGFGAIELSENVIDLTMDQKVDAIERSRALGFEVFFEYGPKYEDEAIDPDEAAAQIGRLIEAGSTKVILERSQLDATLGPAGDWPTAGKLIELAEKAGVENIVFEAETLDHQVWLISRFGAEVNLGPNIDLFHVVSQLEQARMGIGRAEGYSFFGQLGATGHRQR